MPVFKCKVIAPGGRKTAVRTLKADSKDSLKQHLEDEGNFVIKIERAGEKKSILQSISFHKSFSQKDFFAFNQEFSVLLKAGLPVVNAFDAIIEKNNDNEFNSILKEIRDMVYEGESLPDAFDKYSHIFSKLYIATLRAGEKGGDLISAIRGYLEYMKKIAEIRQKVIAASVYPIILTVVSAFTLMFLLIYVVPTFTESFFDAGTRLPLITEYLIRFSAFLRANFIFILTAIGLIIVLIIYIKRSDKGREYWDRWKLKIPFIGDIYIYYLTSKFARTMSTVMGGGTSLLESVNISAKILDNLFFRKKINTVMEKIEQGYGFAQSLADSGLFPKLAIRMIDAGEGSGALNQVLDDVADFYDNDLNTRLSILTSAIEPGLMVIMGFLIGFIVLAMYMPIFQLAGAIM